MPIPLILPALFAAGSIAANTIGHGRASSALAGVNSRETKRQSDFDRLAFDLNEKAVSEYEDFRDQKDVTSEELTEYFKGAATEAPIAEAAVPKTNSNLVVSADATAAEKAKQKGDARAEALGNLRSLGDLLGNFGRRNQQFANELNTLGSFKRGSASILPAEQAAAQQQGSGFRTLGDLLTIGSALTLPAALTAPAATGPAWLTSLKPTAAGTAAQTGGYSSTFLPALY